MILFLRGLCFAYHHSPLRTLYMVGSLTGFGFYLSGTLHMLCLRSASHKPGECNCDEQERFLTFGGCVTALPLAVHLFVHFAFCCSVLRFSQSIVPLFNSVSLRAKPVSSPNSPRNFSESILKKSFPSLKS